MAGLAPGGGAFLTFYVVVLAGFFALAAFFRLLGTMCSNYDVAARLASIIVTIMILYSGYLIPVSRCLLFFFSLAGEGDGCGGLTSRWVILHRCSR